MSSAPRGLTDDEVAQACKEPDAVTQPYFFQQTMYRVKDPKKSLEFYTNVLGMRLVHKFDFPAMQFTVYFLAYSPKEEIPTDEKERVEYCFSQKATLELTHNYGTENDEGFAYHNGNNEPKGYGHIGICVPDVYDACKRFEEMGVNFIKKPDDGKMKGLAFITDPDGYWIEIIAPKNMVPIVGK